MSRLSIARRAALVVAAAAGVCGLSSTASAQRSTPRHAYGPPPERPTPPATPYPGATVTVDQRFYGHRRFPQFDGGLYDGGFYGRGRGVVVVPVYYPVDGYGGPVYDANGVPLWNSYGAPAPQMVSTMPPPSNFPMATPDLSGSPYVVIEGGAMVVDFGNGDRRAVPACGEAEKASTPDGRPRTIFYRPPAYSLLLRPGQRGQVLGRPPAGARVCYTVDAYGRTVLAY